MPQAPTQSRHISNRVHTTFMADVTPDDPVLERHYTLTHSDRTGHYYVSVGLAFHDAQIQGAYTRFKRDEVLAEWTEDVDGGDAMHGAPIARVLQVHVHVSGGKIFGGAAHRNRVWMRTLPQALQALYCADRYLLMRHPELESSDVYIHFHSDVDKYDRIECWGKWGTYANSHHVD